MNSQLVSICIPTFNSECFLEDTLRSIINQTYYNIEIIIGDNASTDRTSKIIKEHPLFRTGFSYERFLSLIRYMKLESKLQFLRRELAVKSSPSRLIKINK